MSKNEVIHIHTWQTAGQYLCPSPLCKKMVSFLMTISITTKGTNVKDINSVLEDHDPNCEFLRPPQEIG